MQYKFLIYISYSYAIPIGNPLEEEIKKRGDKVMWFADREDGQSAIKNKPNACKTIEDALTYAPHIILTATDSVPDFFNALKVQVFHGFNAEKRPTKNNNFAHFRLRGFFDLYCTQGPNTTRGFEEQAQKHPYFEVVETGWSKVDPLFPIKKKQKSDKPVVMIASTFTERLSLAYNNNVYNEIKRLSLSEHYQFITVLHPKLPKAIIQKWKNLENANFKFYDTTDLVPLFKKADIMFADTTSAIQEFLLQKKPVVTFNHTFNKNYLINITDVSNIDRAFKDALSGSSELHNYIESYIRELHPYSDGLSSKRVIDASISFLHKDKTHLKSKPLNLVRKYKMRKRLRFFSFKSYNKPFTIRQPIAKLTALVITYNEHIHIDELIENLSFADECIVVDSFSTDGTFEKLKAHKNVKVYQREFKNFADQKNYALSLASNDWVLFTDADERVTEDFKRDALNKINNPNNEHVAYFGLFKYYFGKTPIHFSGFQTAKSYRLFRASKCKYDSSKIVHEKLIVDGESDLMKHKIIHYSFRDYQHYKEKMTHYAHLKAQILFSKGKKVNFLKSKLKPLYKFFNHYIIRLGILDGKVGYYISKLNAYETKERYKELDRLNNQSLSKK